MPESERVAHAPAQDRDRVPDLGLGGADQQRRLDGVHTIAPQEPGRATRENAPLGSTDPNHHLPPHPRSTHCTELCDNDVPPTLNLEAS